MGGMDLSPAGFRIFHFAEDGSYTVDHRTTVNQSILRIVSPAATQVFAPCTARVIVAAEPGVAITKITALVDGVGEVMLKPTGGWTYSSETLTTLCQPGQYLVDVAIETADGASREVDAEIVVGTALPAPAIGNWKMFQGDAQHTGSRAERIEFPLRTEWVATVGANIHGGAPIVADGRVFVSVTDFGSGLAGGVVALDLLSGRTLWEHRVGFSVRNAAAVVGDTVVFVSNDGTVHGVGAATGEGLWTYELAPQVPTVQRNIYSSPTAVGAVVYVGGRHEFAALVAATGELVWNVEPMDNFGDLSSHASAAVVDDIVIIPFNRRDGLFAFDRETGNELWKTGPEVVQAVHGSPVIAGNEVYVINELTQLTSLDVIDSQQKWGLTLETGAFGWGFLAESTPVIQGTTLVVGTQRGGLHAVDIANHAMRWTFEANLSLIRATHYHGESAAITAAPVITGDLVWVPGQDGLLRALDLVSGEERWRSDLGVPMSSSPAIAGDLLVIASFDGSVRAMRSAPTASATKR
jgi:outer membrane protein assembly factor BamB